MVAMIWGRSPPAAGRPPVARAALQRADQAVEAASAAVSGGPGERSTGSILRGGGRRQWQPGHWRPRPRRSGPVAGVAGGRVPALAAAPVRGLVAVFITVTGVRTGPWWRRFPGAAGRAGVCGGRRPGAGGAVPRRARRRPGPAPRSSRRAIRARKSASFSTAVRVRACSMPAAASGRGSCAGPGPGTA